MELNLQIMREDLKPLSFESFYSNHNYELTCSYPLLYTPGMKLSSSPVYLAEARELPPNPPNEVPLSLICVGIPPRAYLRKPHNVLYTTEDVDLLALHDQTMELFDSYGAWQRNLEELLTQNRTVKELGLASLLLFDQPLYLQTSGFKCLFHIIPKGPYDTVDYETYIVGYGGAELADNSYLSLDGINDLISDDEYNRATEAVEPTIYSGAKFGFRSLFYNIGKDGSFVARLLVDEVKHKLSDRDFALIKVLGSYMERSLLEKGIDRFNRPADVDEILQGLLSHRLLAEDRIISMLLSLKWNSHDRFFCMVMESISDDRSEKALQAIALNLAGVLKSECYLIFDKRLVFACNLSQMHQSLQDVLTNVLPLLRDNLLIAGISDEFDDFKNLYYYYHQALSALEFGRKTDPMLWYFRYENYALLNLISRCKGKQIDEALFPHGFKALLAYDERKGTDYTQLLKAYLQHNMSVTETTRAVYLHRNTCAYRLRRINEISGLDLDDPDTRLQLLIAFKLREIDLARPQK